MIRSTILCASFAVLATAAAAQEPAPAKAPEETAAIIDAKQVGTRDEAKLYAASEFLQADQNADGKIDKEEFIAYASVRAPMYDPLAERTADAVGEKNANKAEKLESAAADKAKNAEEQFAAISKGDEAISKNEMVEARVAQFDAADADKDETLDASERVQFAALTTLKAPENAL